MNIESATMDVPWYQAREAYRNYRQAIKENRATKDDVVIARAYHALIRGRKVIDLHKAIADSGRWPHGHRWYGTPKLAVSRADWLQVAVEYGWATGGGRTLDFKNPSVYRRSICASVSLRHFKDGLPWEAVSQPSRRALVPTIPPQFRPKDTLSNYHLLFEADWSSAPIDPLLLKHIGGVFYVVLAAWDLTPIEQAVLRQKLA